MESITFVLLFLSKQVYEDQLKLNRESKAEKSEIHIWFWAIRGEKS